MFGLLFLNVLTAWKTSTQRCCRNISHTILTLQKTPLRPPPFLKRRSQDTGEESRRREEERKRKEKDRCLCYSVFHHLMATYHCCWKLSSNLFVCFLQAVYHRPSLSSVVLLLPLLHLMNQFEEGAFGCGRVPVHWPTQELELLDHTVPVLWLQNKGTNRTLNTPQNQTKCTYIKRTPKINQTHVYQTHPKLWEEEEKKSEGRRRRWEEEEWQGRMSRRKKRKEKKRKGKGERREEMSGRAESERRKEKHFPPHTNQDWRETRRDDSGTILHWN